MEEYQILLVDNDKSALEKTKHFLSKQKENYKIYTANSIREVKKLDDKLIFDIIVFDYRMINTEGIDLLLQLKAKNPHTTQILCVAGDSAESTFQLLNLKSFQSHLSNSKTENKLVELLSFIEYTLKNRISDNQLQKKQELFDIIVQSISDIIIITDFDFKIQFVSPSIQGLLGYSIEESAELKLQDILSPSSQKYVEPLISEFLMRKKAKRFTLERIITLQLELVCKNGSFLWTEVKLSYLLDKENNITGLLSIVRDISDRRITEETLDSERKAFQLIAEASISKLNIDSLCERVLIDLINILDFNSGTIRLYNENTQTLFPVAIQGSDSVKEELNVMQKLTDVNFISAEVARERKAIIAPDIEKNDISSEFPLQIISLQAKALIAWPIISSDNRLLGVVKLISENIKNMPESSWIFFETIMRFFATILERKQAERLLLDQQSLLQKQRDELESFASTIAHDIRGKLQVISMYNSLSKSIHSNKIDEQIGNISAFIEDLLLLAKKGEILGNLSEINLTILLKEIIEDVNSIAPDLKIELKELPKIKGDKTKLRQVFENLIMNVVKHANATKIKIYYKKAKDTYQIFIEDNGNGISLNKQKEIKLLLEKENYSSFGLLIVQKIMEAHHGSMGFESEEGLGTIFVICFPK